MNMPTPQQLNSILLPNTALYGLQYTQTEPNIVATITQNEHNSQHTGVIQGGVLCVLAETVANMAGSLAVPRDRYVVLGQSLNTHYIRGATGTITATVEPIRVGRSSCVYSVEMTDERGKTVAISTFTGSIVKRKA